jgi:hypothetical protein
MKLVESEDMPTILASNARLDWVTPAGDPVPFPAKKRERGLG